MRGIVVCVGFVLVIVVLHVWGRGVVVDGGGLCLVAGGVVLHHRVVLKANLFE